MIIALTDGKLGRSVKDMETKHADAHNFISTTNHWELFDACCGDDYVVNTKHSAQYEADEINEHLAGAGIEMSNDAYDALVELVEHLQCVAEDEKCSDTPSLFEPLETCDVCEKSGGRCNSCFMDAPVIATEVLPCSK